LTTVVVVYFSTLGATQKLARQVLAGINTVEDVKAIEYQIQARDIFEGRFDNDEAMCLFDSADAIVMGSPTYMGGVAAQFKAFADASSERWDSQRWRNKFAAGFTVGSCLNGDQANSLQYMATLASQHGMLWVGLDLAGGYNSVGLNRLGCQLGVVSHNPEGEINHSDLDTAKYLGRRVATITKACASALNGL
jgi:NAD(P)H dehydrogenase (quinone)